MSLSGADLQFLAAVSELARLDLESASIGLIASHGTLTARYRSPYAMGERQSPYDGPDLMCEVDAERFKALASLFPSQQSVSFALNKGTLTITGSGGQRRVLALQIRRDEVEDLTELDTCQPDLLVKINVDELRAECELAKQFVAKNYSQPILTGFNLDISRKLVKISAWDSVAALFVSTIDTLSGRKGEDSVNTTVPELDFGLGLKVVGNGEALLEVVLHEQDEGLAVSRVRVVGSISRFSCTPLIGDWPDLSPVTEKKKYTTSINLPGQVLKDAVAGVKALNPNYAKSGIEITTDSKRRLQVRTKQAEHGQFVVRAGSETVDDDVNFSYSVSSMALASELGDNLTFDIPEDNRSQTRIRSGKRKCWVSPIVG